MGSDKPSRDDRPQLSEVNREEWMQGLTESERQAADASRNELRGLLRQMAAGELDPTVVDGEAESVSLPLNAEEAVTVELPDGAESATLIARSSYIDGQPLDPSEVYTFIQELPDGVVELDGETPPPNEPAQGADETG